MTRNVTLGNNSSELQGSTTKQHRWITMQHQMNNKKTHLNSNNEQKNVLTTMEGKKTIVTWFEGNETLIRWKNAIKYWKLKHTKLLVVDGDGEMDL